MDADLAYAEGGMLTVQIRAHTLRRVGLESSRHMTEETWTSTGWWYKPEYIINHMNINSAMFEPRHNSFVKLDAPPKTVKALGSGKGGVALGTVQAPVRLCPVAATGLNLSSYCVGRNLNSRVSFTLYCLLLRIMHCHACGFL